MLDGRSWTLAEVPQDESQYSGTVVRVGVNAAGVDRPSPPAVVTQHVQLDRQFVIINSKVVTSFTAVCSSCGFAAVSQ